MIQLSGVALARGAKPLLSDAELRIHAGERVGVIGQNGCGKSTLFTLLRGELAPDAGTCSVPADWRIAAMEQEVVGTERRAIDFVLDGDTEFRALEAASGPVRPERAPVAAVTAWQDALLTVARRFESAWLGLLEALAREGREWDAEVQDLRRWRRPAWPLYATAALLFGVALYVGLVLGGYLPVPGPVRPLVEELWARWS